MNTIRLTSLTKWLAVLAILATAGPLCAANAVNVTIVADSTTLMVGQSTTVTVYGQIDAAIAATSDQVFSWYIDVLNDDGTVVSGYSNVQTPASDNNASTSSDGTPSGDNLTAVRDTFLNTMGAGKGAPVVLVQFEVMAQSAGVATFSVGPGSTGLPLSDFLVAKTGGGAYTGGNYTAAAVAITVSGGGGPPDLSALNLSVTVTGNQADVMFTPQVGFDHTVEWSPDFGTVTPWAPLPGGPHNSGMVSHDITGIPRAWYRVDVVPQ